MRLGIFASVFPRASVEETFDALRGYGLTSTQFDLSVVGPGPLPEDLPDTLASRIRRAAADRGIAIAAVEGTFNMAHPDPAHRADGLRRFAVLAAAAPKLGTSMLTLCTGTRDPDNMWRRHPDNTTAAAWQDMRSTVEQAVALADQYDLVLGVEPEISNVISSADAARRLLDELGSPRLKIIFDGANLFDVSDPQRQLPRADAVFAHAAELLGSDIALAHAKDISESGRFAAVAEGDLPWASYLETLRQAGFGGSVIMHGLKEAQVPAAVDRLRGLLPSS
jgi:sugar phosphate isomerase/epimerase